MGDAGKEHVTGVMCMDYRRVYYSQHNDTYDLRKVKTMSVTVKAQEAIEGTFINVPATSISDGSPARSNLRVDAWVWVKEGDGRIQLMAEHDFSRDSGEHRTHSIAVPVTEDCTCNVELPKFEDN